MSAAAEAQASVEPRPTTQAIDQVIAELDAIIVDARRRGSRHGYFAALYKRVTVRVRDGIARGEFQDGARMERFDVAFANRYLEAYRLHAAGEPTTRCWGAAFAAVAWWRPVVLQHLLFGMNAHINLDLGIAAARTAPGSALAALQVDFERINTILAELGATVKQELEAVWPMLRWVDRFSGPEQDMVVNFSMTRARECAWALAERLAPLGIEDQNILIESTDVLVCGLGHLIGRPGIVLAATLLLIRLGERGSVAEIIDRLNRV